MHAVNLFAYLMVYQALRRLLADYLPSHCRLCDARTSEDPVLCENCLAQLPWWQEGCRHCGLALIEAEICGQCLQKGKVVDRVVALFRYEGKVAPMLHGLKFGRELSYAACWGRLLARKICSMETSAHIQAIIPVPLHYQRLRQRGFNQSLEIAKPIAQALALPIFHHAVVRLKATAAQAELSKEERRRNVRNAFNVVAPLPKRVAIVDDVMTTTATARALVKVLRAHGVEWIEWWGAIRS